MHGNPYLYIYNVYAYPISPSACQTRGVDEVKVMKLATDTGKTKVACTIHAHNYVVMCTNRELRCCKDRSGKCWWGSRVYSYSLQQ